MASNTPDSDLLDADLTRVLVLDAELVRREGRSVCLVIKDGRMPSRDATRNRLAEQPTARTVRAAPVPTNWAPEQGWLPGLVWSVILLVIGGILAGVCLARFFMPHSLPAQELIVLLILAVLLLGRRLPEVGRYLGRGIIEFRKGMKGLEEEDSPPRTHRATVRYYSRMNPQRVYPLLVLITRDLIEQVHKKHTDQRTSNPFAIDAGTPVEIEPILPGCDCHPPRVVTRLGQGDMTLTFRVVPRVLGKVDGAVVCIRQDHASLAEIELKAKVVKQTWVALAGLGTFLLPGLSAVMKHFGLDFETQKEQGFSLYLAIAQLVFDRVSPYALTALLGVATALLWWLTRPHSRDVFWDIRKVGPAAG
jgi:sec-independent protein translocase protein TatA